MLRVLLLSLGLICLSGCSYINKLVYKIDIPQGNYIDENQVKKLRIGMTKEQVTFVLGTPMSNNPFEHNKWNYVYRYKTGKGNVLKKRLFAYFGDDELLEKVTGDYKLSEHFDIPVDQDIPDLEESLADDQAGPTAPKESSLWSIKLGEFSALAKVNELKQQLEQAGYEVYLFPQEPVDGQKTQVFAAAGTNEDELEDKLEAIIKLTQADAEIARLPGS